MSTSPRKRPASEAIVAGGVVILLIAIVALVFWSGAGSALYPPPAVTEQGRAISGLYDIVFAIAVAIFIAVEGLIVWSVLRYRRRPGDVDLPPQTHGNNLVEALWTLIPTVIVLYLFVISWDTLNTVDRVSADPGLHVNALGSQFRWQFEYLDEKGEHLATQTEPSAKLGGGMAVPVGTKVFVSLISEDVIHAWYVPQFLFKRDVVPGQTNHFEVTVDAQHAGQTFHGQCAELCGTGHEIMQFDVLAMTPTDFETWLDALVEKENATPPPPPSGAPVVPLAAKNVAYDKHDLEVGANAPFAIEFKNEDPAALTHDVDIKGLDGTSVIADQSPIAGGTTTTYSYEALPAGTYQYFCSVHPGVAAMTGNLTVK